MELIAEIIITLSIMGLIFCGINTYFAYRRMGELIGLVAKEYSSGFVVGSGFAEGLGKK